jgi:hypothetical protein
VLNKASNGEEVGRINKERDEGESNSRMTRQFGCIIAEWKLIKVRNRGEIGVIECV